MATKQATRKTTAPASKATTREDLPRLAEKKLGWSPRVTEYLFTESEVRRMRASKDFSETNVYHQQNIVGGLDLREIGALRQKDGSNHRIVEVLTDKKE